MARSDNSTFNGQLDLKGVYLVVAFNWFTHVQPPTSSPTHQPFRGKKIRPNRLRAEKNATTESIQKKLDEALAAKAPTLGFAQMVLVITVGR